MGPSGKSRLYSCGHVGGGQYGRKCSEIIAEKTEGTFKEVRGKPCTALNIWSRQPCYGVTSGKRYAWETLCLKDAVCTLLRIRKFIVPY